MDVDFHLSQKCFDIVVVIEHLLTLFQSCAGTVLVLRSFVFTHHTLSYFPYGFSEILEVS